MNQEASEPLPCPVPSPSAIVSLGPAESPWARSAYDWLHIWCRQALRVVWRIAHDGFDIMHYFGMKLAFFVFSPRFGKVVS